jgi:hypothetical protein
MDRPLVVVPALPVESLPPCEGGTMNRDNDADELHIVDLLMANDSEIIEWLQKLGLVEIGEDGTWRATDLARRSMARSWQQLIDCDIIRPPRSSMH